MDLDNIRGRLDVLSAVDCPSNRIAKQLLAEVERLRAAEARVRGLAEAWSVEDGDIEMADAADDIRNAVGGV